MTYEEFTANYLYTNTAERSFQIAIQAAIDVGSMILADESYEIPNTYADIFSALAEIGVLPETFAQKMVGMVKFRNVLVHLYLQVDLRRVYRYLQENLEDFEQFIRYVSDWLAEDDVLRC
jgi:uncharacterized protein YutE (UPF0331/DUF86 family)